MNHAASPPPLRFKDRIETLCAEMAERGIGRPIAFVIKCRPDDVEQGLFRYLQAKGLVRAYVGIETHAALPTQVLHALAAAVARQKSITFQCSGVSLAMPSSLAISVAISLVHSAGFVMKPSSLT